MNEDRYGLPLATDSAAAAASYRDGIDCILAAWPGAAAALDGAIAADPDFALAWLARARVHHMFAEPALAREKVARARALAARASERERAHVAIIGDAIEGRSADALAAALAHLETWPRDALVMATPLGAFGLLAFSGRADHDAARVELCERHARHYGEDWWFLTHRGWAHTEAGHLAVGQRYTEQALSLRRENGNAAHAFSHSLFERGAVEEGIAFIEDWLPGYDRGAILNAHIAWHLALFALDRGDTEKALALYEERLAPKSSLAPPLNTLTDAASLLWRLELEPGAQKRDWRDTAAYGARTFPHAGIAFADVHAALTDAACGDCGALERRIAELRGLAAVGRLPPGDVVIALCQGFRAFAEGDFQRAADTLGPALADVTRIGGSHAQREICEDTYVAALIRAGRSGEARRVLDERLERRPSGRDRRWRDLAAG